MKKARLILSASMIALMGLSAVTFSSCTKDSEDCAVGYTGKNCGDEIRTPMLGTYNATDVDDATGVAEDPYNPVISANSSVSIVNIQYLTGLFTVNEIVTSNVKQDGDNISFTIPSQKPDNVYTVSGSGTYNPSTKKININYAVVSPSGVINNYTGTWNQQ